MGELKILKGPKQFQTNYLKKRTGQTLEALDWLRRSFCSKIFEYFLRSFLIIWKRQRDICCKRKFHCHKSKVWQISSTCSTSTQDVVVVSLRSDLESGAAVQLSYEVSEKLFSLSSLAPHTHIQYIKPHFHQTLLRYLWNMYLNIIYSVFTLVRGKENYWNNSQMVTTLFKLLWDILSLIHRP